MAPAYARPAPCWIAPPAGFPAIRAAGRASGGDNGSLSLSDLEQFIHKRIQNKSRDLYAEWQGVAERHLYVKVLQHTRGNLSQAARILGISRITLRTKIRAMGVLDDDETIPESELSC